jgi:S1-C subfamily serine protease
MRTGMNNGLIAAAFAACLGWASPTQAAPAAVCASGGQDTDPATLFEQVSPAVVTIEASGEGSKAIGTGFLWDRSGHVVTNEHVVRSGRQLTVHFADGRVVRPTMIAAAEHLDVAVLRVDAPAAAVPVGRGGMGRLKVGQWVFAIGNPYGIGVSLTRGIVSGLDRTVELGEGKRIANAIQTDASLNPGNSGGPLLDARGCLVGMATALVAAQAAQSGIGFAVPVDLLERTVASLIGGPAEKAPNVVERSELGILAEDAKPGVRIVKVVPGSRAAALDAKPGDVITHANGQPVSGVSDLAAHLKRQPPSGMRLTFQRGEASRTVEILLAAARS